MWLLTVATGRRVLCVRSCVSVTKNGMFRIYDQLKNKNIALLTAKEYLDSDVSQFDAFLQASDARTHKGVKKAEEINDLKHV